MELQPDALTAAGEVCARQEEHLHDVLVFLDRACDRPEALGGVLTPFRGAYEAAVAAGRRGVGQSARTSRQVGRGMLWFRDDLLGLDADVETRLRRRHPDVDYRAPGGGVAPTVAGPAGAAVTAGWPRGPGGAGGHGGAGGAPPPGPGGLVGDVPLGGSGERGDAAEDRARTWLDERAGRPVDPDGYADDRRRRRDVLDALDVLAGGGVRQAVDDLVGRAGDLRDSLEGVVDAAGDAGRRDDLVDRPAEAAAGLREDAQGWWR